MATNQWIFTATDPAGTGVELWVTGGTPASTRLLKDIWAAPQQSSQPSGLTDLGNGKMLFAATADNTNTGRELWITDGTTAGTRMVKDLYPGAAGSSPSNFIKLGNGKVLFSAGNAQSNGNLWISDGTETGTTLVENIFGPNNGNSLAQFTRFGANKVVFSALDFGSGMGNVLWVSDGTAAGTFLLKALGNGSAPNALTDLGNGRLVFSATDSTNGTELWVTDGTAAGTTVVKDIRPGGGSSFPGFGEGRFVTLGNGRAVFRVNDGTHGDELWSTDGTAAGTRLLADIAPGANGANPAYVYAIGNGKALFAASNGTSYGQLWVTNGSPTGTKLVKDFQVGVNGAPSDFYRLPNGKVLFSGQTTNNGRELWITDGTTAGTTMVKDIAPGSSSSSPYGFAALRSGKVVFNADGELWVGDGTAAGTRLVVDLTPGFNNSTVPTSFKSLGDGRVTFTREVDSAHGRELWVTDGTAAGTVLLKDINPGTGTSNPSVPVLLQKVFTINGTSANDTLSGGILTDIIYSNAGDDRIDGKAGDDQLIGGAGADTLIGGSGIDILRGGTGRDVLTGGTSRDFFVFDTAPERDTITDFAAGADKIRLSQKIFAGINHTGALLADEFYAGSGATSGHDASDRVIYNTASGVLYYDADGQGGAAAVEIALLGTATHPALAFTDIQIVA